MSLNMPTGGEAVASAPSQQPMETAPSPPTEDGKFVPAPASATTESAPTSQPMTATPSNSSEHLATDQHDAGAGTSYGTRSRNRPNGSRPNYADDKDIDLEIEAANKAAKANKKAALAAASNTTNGPATAADTVDVSNGIDSAAAPAASTALSHPPGSGHYNVLPPPQPTSKKRKAPGSGATVMGSTTSTSTAYRSRMAASQQPRFYVETNMMSFERGGSRLNSKKQLVADDGTTLQPNDHAYFICEPPGEPYYLARIMEFLHANNDANGPVDAVRVNWYYRPKDIQRRVQDTRVVFASMHSDTCPLTSIRGKCRIEHMANIANMDDFRVQKDCFWFDKLYDRYMHRYYEVVPTDKVVNVPPHVKKVLDKRWKFVLVEVGRGRDLTAASKKCKRCQEFAANHDSVDCAVCKFTYHMACVRPPLLKKPARGFAWACAACSRAQELALQARNTPTASDSAPAADDDAMDDDDESPHGNQMTRDSSVGLEPHPPPTAAQLAVANLWPYRYLGIHSKAEDALDYDDRIYPRASSRLGPRHQANVMVWHGRPIELVKPAEGKKKYKPAGGKMQAKATTTDSDKDKRLRRPKWVIDEPPGYVARGHDDPVEVKGGKKEHTAQLTFMLPEADGVSSRGLDDGDQPLDYDEITDEYMTEVKALAAQYGVLEVSTDFLTKAVEKLQEHQFDVPNALEAMKHLSLRGDLKQPDLNREEIKRFEEGVSKYGSELHLVARHVSPTIKESRIVRFYYMWKKTDRGKQIWGSYEGRKSKKESRRVDKDGTTKLLDDVADDHDDSAFDNEKAVQKKRGFVCKFCDTRSSRQWRRAPSTAPGTLVPLDPAAKPTKDKSSWLVLALCGKCAYLWRRYAIQYESIEEVARKIAAAGGRASKRRIDEELMRTVIEAQCEAGDTITKNVAQLATSAGVEVPAAMVQSDEPPKKKTKAEKEVPIPAVEAVVEKKKPVDLEPLEPEPPRVKVHPCAVCGLYDLPQDKTLKCRDCRLHVHTSCYGVSMATPSNYWYCDTCNNDHNTQVSTIYECVLCPVNYTPQELMEPPRVTHKKKSDREREKERLEREMVQDAGRRWRQEQEAAGRPVNPREPLKPTASNNWIHVYCAIWTKEIKFGNPESLHAAEGMGLIPQDRYTQPCKICKKTDLPSTTCHFPNCNAVFHVGCAHQAGYKFGFDVSPVKGSRRDSVAVMKLDQEIGAATPAVWCSSHTAIPTLVHEMTEVTPSGLTAMQEYARVYKQVDNSVTATARRAQQIILSTAPAVQPPNRRTSTVHGATQPTTPGERTTGRGFRSSPSPISPNGERLQSSNGRVAGAKRCCSCLVDVSPRWWLVDRPHDDQHQVNGYQDRRVIDLTMGTPHRTSVNGLIKREPIDLPPVTIPYARDTACYQCHKCHIEKRTPPSSPSQVKPKDRPAVDPVVEPIYFTQPPYQPQPPISQQQPPLQQQQQQHQHPHQHQLQLQQHPQQQTQPSALPLPPPPPPPPPSTQSALYPPGRSAYESPVHNHSHPLPPPPPQLPTSGVLQPPSWSAPAPHWAPPPPPVHQNNHPAPPGPVYGASHPPYRPSSHHGPPGPPPPPPPPTPPTMPPHHPLGPEYAPRYQHNPYQQVQRQPPPSLPPTQSPLQGPYRESPSQPPPPAPPKPTTWHSPPLNPYNKNRKPKARKGPSVSSPTSGLSTSVLSQPFAPPHASHPPPIESPPAPYATPPGGRPYQLSPSLPLPPSIPRPSSAQSLAQIAQAATEQANYPQHSPVEGMGTPRLGGRDVIARSPGQPIRTLIGTPINHSPGMIPGHPSHPSHQSHPNHPSHPSHPAGPPSAGPPSAGPSSVGPESRKNMGPGASANPSLRNLLI